MSAVASEQNDTALEQALPVADAAAVAVAADADRAVAGFDLSTPEGVRAAADQFPALKAVFADYENTGKQKTLNEIRRDEGNLDRARGTVQWAAEQIRSGADPDEIAKQMAPHVQANHNWARAEVLKGLIKQAQQMDPDSIGPLAELADSLGDNADEIERVATAALKAVETSTGKLTRQQFLDSDALDDIPIDSKKYKAIQDRIAHEVEAELNARNIETNKPNPIPSASPSGTAAEPMTRTRLDSMSHDDKIAYLTGLPAEERSNMWAVAMANE